MPDESLSPRPPGAARPVGAVSLSEIFTAPLRAVIEADAMASRHIAAFIEEYGFERPPLPAGAGGGHLGRLRTVSFRMDRPGPDGEPRAMVARIPTLSLVPLPLLQVKEAEFSYGVRLLQVVEQGSAPARELLRGGAEDAQPAGARMQWNAVLADRSLNDPRRSGMSQQLNANIEVKVKMSQADMPGGISTLLGLMHENTHLAPDEPPPPAPAPAPLPPAAHALPPAAPS